MNKKNLPTALVIFVGGLISVGQIFAQNWPGWRGDGHGISPEKNLPLKWSEDEGVKWKTPIPGAGHSSPIVWGDCVFVTTGVAEDPNVETFKGGIFMGGDRRRPDESEYAYRVICIDADKGDILWSKAIVRQSPKTRRHTKNTYASETPVTDGNYVFASFGSAGLYAVDFQGTVLWKRDLGLMRGRAGWGTGSSPILYQNAVIVNCDSDDDFIGPVNIGNPEEYSIIELAQKIIEITGSKSKLVSKPLPEDDPLQRQPNIDLAKERLGWQPRIGLEEGLQKTIEYFRSFI